LCWAQSSHSSIDDRRPHDHRLVRLIAVQLNLRSEQVAGFLCLLAAALAGVAWYTYLFVADPSERPFAQTALGQFAYTFSPDSADRWWFRWLAATPLALTVIGAAYLSRLARTQAVAILLLAALVVLTAFTLYVANWYLAVFVALPIVWAWRCVRGT
jgi:hypothetical protein